MIPDIVFASTDLQTEIHEDNDIAIINASRQRRVKIKNQNLAEGLYLFRRDETTGLYSGTRTYTSNLAAIKLKSIAGGHRVIAPVRKSYRKIVNASDISNEVLNTLLPKDISKEQLEDYTFEITVREPVRVTTRRNEITSIVIEKQFRSGTAYGRKEETQDYEPVQDMDGTTEDIFLAYIFEEKDRDHDITFLVIIDIGELWDLNRISFEDLLDILTHSDAPEVNQREWMRHQLKLTPEQKREISDKHDAMKRANAFDDIMKQNNPNFDSNKEN